ncbi:hypothetical protein [Limnochorda pilosa]|uniref:hypothetical protein n=1 Tax=Limnochorda pilosa TaxID=1555112 RepID=UPI00130DFDB0|nr:hypothetical protein [Limnochorda pilosa]
MIHRDVVRSTTTGEEVRVGHVPHLICTRCGRTVLTPEMDRRVADAVAFAAERGATVLA